MPGMENPGEEIAYAPLVAAAVLSVNTSIWNDLVGEGQVPPVVSLRSSQANTAHISHLAHNHLAFYYQVTGLVNLTVRLAGHSNPSHQFRASSATVSTRQEVL